MKKIFRGLLLTLFLLLPTSSVRADIAPPQPPTGTNIVPGGDVTQVRMVSEQVVIDVATHNTHPTGDATITASFQMRNLGQETEKMNVRFPLCKIENMGGVNFFNFIPMDNYPYPPIDNFAASVSGKTVGVFNTKYYEADLAPCWANFPAVFPPGQDVSIKVSYHQIGYGGYDHGSENYIIYTYILFTGAAWKDTIGSADFTVKLPIPANSYTVYESPQNATLSGQEIHWHAEDFKPDDKNGVLSVGILQPEVWRMIEKESANVATGSKDGEAWGRLGKAYKEAALMEHGWRDDSAGLELAQKGMDAYQHAVDLLPNDADWHYGYAGLVCWELFFPWNVSSLEKGTQQQLEYNHICIEQLNLALKLNPKHEAANELKKDLLDSGIIQTENQDGTGAIIDYPLLTVQPTPDFSPFSTPEADVTAMPTNLPAPTMINPILPPTTQSTLQPEAPTVTFSPTVTTIPQAAPLCGGSSVLVILLLLLGWFFRN
jgi:hypothetical protein